MTLCRRKMLLLSYETGAEYTSKYGHSWSFSGLFSGHFSMFLARSSVNAQRIRVVMNSRICQNAMGAWCLIRHELYFSRYF